MIHRFLAIAIVFLGSLLLYPAITRADDTEEFQRLISEQIAAFNADDGAKAYSYAAPIIQRIFPSPGQFMDMVKRGYQPVYRQRSFRFAETKTDPAGRPAQAVTIVDVNGKTWTALYTFERQPDGTWKISGCTLLEALGADA
jgi:Domain of unknown function (DUF4864)